MSRKRPTFADYLVIAITPALIMMLVGSLVFFLLTAFFDGTYEARVRYIFSLFIFAAVLIGRISIEEGRDQAVLYGVPLAVAAWLALGRFCETNSFVTIIIIAIIWWSAHKLTWDCTVIDEAEEAESSGLLQSAGFEAIDDSADQSLERDLRANRDSETERPTSLKGLWQRWIENRKKPHSPGVWVIYFALATLPLFGIGPWAIPAADLAARRSAFHCLLVYVTCAMTLLGTTSFLGLRRYLRQRKLEMPVDMAVAWAGAVATIMFVIVLVAIFLPRPEPEYLLSHVLGSRDIDRPSPFSFLKGDGVESPDSGEQSNISPQELDRPTERPDSSKTPSEEGQRSAERSNESPPSSSDESPPSSSDESPPNSSDRQGESGRSDQQESDDSGRSPPKDDQQNRSQQDRRQEQEDAFDEDARQETQSDDGEPSHREDEQEDQRDASARSRPSETQNRDAPETSRQESREAPRPAPDRTVNTPSPSPQSILKPLFDFLGGGIIAVLRMLYWLALIAAGIYFCFRYSGVILAALRTFLSDLFRLFGRRESPDEAAAGEPTETKSMPSKRPFASFTDPIQSGQSMSDRELVRYTFLALEAWAYENNCGRTTAETPLEFELRLANRFPSMKDATAYAVQLYDRMAYASSAPRLSRDRLGQLWQYMRASR